MKRWFTLLLLAGALLGLVGQEAAFARVMPAPKAEPVSASEQMSPECAEMMGLTKQKPKSDQPCQGMTPECIAKMGCAAPLALLPPLAPDAAPEFRAMLPDIIPAAPLVGRNFGPEPEPPARLG
ncbi:hypothetical protein KRR38_33310 [Novosphingobium sp. G106]|uniref:hypothetical protein n=1 Tax=Novosphingobium sp. G106 TaxID=2849500 RepID=UPI001C2CD3AB|nr:hypothetical protein [Novosphingobium sp. G106]MBV1692389.1 hypothetical protein [Novosphingobium sp. G106]